ncbi:Putative uncharacterized protein [Moritella viscosa]|nr:Putative uncharacterized protein [Moritella viscosa]
MVNLKIYFLTYFINSGCGIGTEMFIENVFLNDLSDAKRY